MQAAEQAMLIASLAPGTVSSSQSVAASPVSGNSRISAAQYSVLPVGSVVKHRHAR
jgi:hypothetical protein